MSRRPVLLVEGRDDREVVYQFCNRHGIDNRLYFDVEDTDGYTELLDDLRVRPKSGVPVVAAIIDADFDLNARWNQLVDKLSALGYSLPASPSAGGTFLDAPQNSTLAKVALWIMPDNRVTGMMEDFLQRLVPNGDPLLILAETTVANIPAERRRFKDTYVSKAVVHTWLAWQKEPGTPLGLAITKHYLDTSKDIAKDFEVWLRQSFGIPGSTSGGNGV